MLLHLELSRGKYVTFNAVSSAATILFGVLVGERSPSSHGKKLGVLVVAGGVALAVGWALSGGGGWLPVSFTPLVPMIKKLWTASFAIFAAGWTCWMLAVFYAIVEGWRSWTFPFVVVGMNSIAMYIFAGVFKGNADRRHPHRPARSRRRRGDGPPAIVRLHPHHDFRTGLFISAADQYMAYLTPMLESASTVLSILWAAWLLVLSPADLLQAVTFLVGQVS